MTLADDLARLSHGRVTYDAGRRRLRIRDDGESLREIAVGETDLRNWLQRLLLTTPHESGREPQEAAILILLARLETVTARDPAAGPPGSAAGSCAR